jgi:hypothetical protein
MRLSFMVWFVGVLFSPTVRAEDPSDTGLETIPYRLSTVPSHFITVRGIPDEEGGNIATRLGYLDRPISMIVPSAAPEGTTSEVIRGALVLEVAMARMWKNGLDLGLGMGAHLYQFGDGLGILDGQERKLPPFGAIDPMLELGYRHALSANLSLRTFGAVYVPIGSREALAGERKTRVEGGLLITQDFARVQWASELSALYRAPADFRASRWGSQLKFSLAGRVRMHASWFGGLELLLRPLLVKQPEPHTSLIPAMGLAAMEYRHAQFKLVASYGYGLPISRVSADVTKQKYVRAPTTPVQQGTISLEVGASKDALIDVDTVTRLEEDVICIARINELHVDDHRLRFSIADPGQVNAVLLSDAGETAGHRYRLQQRHARRQVEAAGLLHLTQDRDHLAAILRHSDDHAWIGEDLLLDEPLADLLG